MLEGEALQSILRRASCLLRSFAIEVQRDPARWRALTAFFALAAAFCILIYVLLPLWAYAKQRRLRSKRLWAGLSIFVDLENCPTANIELLRGIKALALELGTHIDHFRVYGELASSPKGLATRRLLLDFGCQTIDTPHNAKKETADKALIYDIADMTARRRVSSVLLVTDDNDFLFSISRTQQKGIPVARAGFNQRAAEVLRADRSFTWDRTANEGNGAFKEDIDAPFRVRHPHMTLRPLRRKLRSTPQDDKPPTSTTTVSALKLNFSERETLLICRPFLMLLSLFYIPGGRESLPVEVALIELGWPNRSDGVNIQARSGFTTFKAWVERAQSLGLLRIVGTGSRTIFKGPDADWTWNNTKEELKAELPPLIERVAPASRSAKASKRRSRIAARTVEHIGADAAVLLEPPSDTASSRQPSQTSFVSASTPPSSVPSSPYLGESPRMPSIAPYTAPLAEPDLHSAIKAWRLQPQRAVSSPLLLRRVSTPSRERCVSLINAPSASPGVGLRLRLAWDTEVMGDSGTATTTGDEDIE